jgi:hypothetical protein
MIGTFVLDAYRKNEIDEMCKAIEDSCSPSDTL